MVLLGFARKPESAPPSIFLQGSGKVDWVTVWFMDMKVNSTMSPGLATRVFGLNMRPASPPTMTCCWGIVSINACESELWTIVYLVHHALVHSWLRNLLDGCVSTLVTREDCDGGVDARGVVA